MADSMCAIYLLESQFQERKNWGWGCGEGAKAREASKEGEPTQNALSNWSPQCCTGNWKDRKKRLYPQVPISRWTKIYNTVLILLHFRVAHTWTPGGVPCHRQDTGKTQPARVGSA